MEYDTSTWNCPLCKYIWTNSEIYAYWKGRSEGYNKGFENGTKIISTIKDKMESQMKANKEYLKKIQIDLKAKQDYLIKLQLIKHKINTFKNRNKYQTLNITKEELNKKIQIPK